MSVFARLGRGATVRAAQAELDIMAPRLAEKLPDLHTGWKQVAVPLLPDLVGNVRPALQALLGAVILVLLIACANVASMLLARGLCTALVSGMLAGLVPALQASRTDVVEALKNGGAGSTARGRARAALVVVEVALALVLAVGAGLMIRTVHGLLAVPVGISDPAHVLVADLDLPDEKYGKPEQVQAFHRE